MQEITTKNFYFHWYDCNDESLILLTKESSTGLASFLRRRYKTNNAFCQAIQSGIKVYYQLVKHKPLRVKTLKNILGRHSFLLEQYDEHVIGLVGPHSFLPVKFPVTLDNNTASILIAAFMSDGNNQDAHPFYSNTDFLGKKILCLVQSFLPHITWEIRNDCLRFHPVLSRILSKLGVPVGNKTKLNPAIPPLIYHNDTFKKAYLTQIFDDEGHAPTKESRKIVLGRSVALHKLPSSFASELAYTKKRTFNSLPPEIQILVNTQPPQLLQGEHSLLKEFGIRSSLRCRGITQYLDHISADWVVEIAGNENIRNFNKQIGFSHPQKIQQITTYLGGVDEKRKKYRRTKT